MPIRSRFRITTSIIGVSIAVAALLAAPVSAGVSIPNLEVFLQVNSADPIPFSPTGESNPDGTFTYNGMYEDVGQWQFDITALFNPDPLISSNIVFTNNTGALNEYVIIVNAPIDPLPDPPGNLMDGSVGGSVTDSNGAMFGADHARISTVNGSQLYVGLLDGAAAAGSELHPFPFSAAPANSGGTENISSASFGQPNPIPTPPGTINNSIGIRLHFTLTPGDSVSITSFFRVEPVPAPGTLALLGIAGLVTMKRRRRG